MMLLSNLLGERSKERPSDVYTESHAILLRGGYIRPVGTGIYTLLSPARRITAKLEAILRREMDSLGGQEVLFPVAMPASLWKESNRYDTIGKELLRFQDRAGRDMVLGMTHEEAAVHLARTEARSYQQYPFFIYQIQTKFRDEPRARSGLLRVREFTMKDAYSFHTSQEDLEAFYQQVLQGYHRIFAAVGIPQVISVTSESGMMGGRISHEFMLLCSAGEDSILLCDACGLRENREVLGESGEKVQDGDPCPVCGKPVRVCRGIEVGNIFQLGDKYTRAMDMTYTGRNGGQEYPVMGCYGIGVGRLLASITEVCHDSRGPIWPVSVAPWEVHVCILPGGSGVHEAGMRLGNSLEQRFDTIIDDRDAPAGVQFADADLLGAPVRVVISSRNLDNGEAELSARDGSARLTVPLDTVETEIRKLLGR